MNLLRSDDGTRWTVKHSANALLLAALLLYLVALYLAARHPLFGYLRAFAEAAMVGALADWFAVSALFRRPLGLPIPHTAVIPRNKDRIGAALGGFVERNFLAPDTLRAQLAQADFAAMFARWLERPKHRALIADYLAEQLPSVLDTVKDEDVRRLLANSVSERIRKLELAPLAAEMLSLLTAENRHQQLIDEMLLQAAALLKESEPTIRDRVRTRTGWLWRQLAVDSRITTHIMGAAEDALTELANDAQHPLRLRFDATVREFIDSLKTAPEYREKVETLKEQLLQHPALRDYLDGLWPDVRQALEEDAARPGSLMRRQLRKSLAMVAGVLLSDPALRARLNNWALNVVMELAESRRHEVSRLIASTVAQWDPSTMAAKIEHEVGDDLQYIRINGTLIGGLAGLLIYAVSHLLPGG
jgi:uncharacterized membrane-anchored protein YjiN (DUF445 family)